MKFVGKNAFLTYKHGLSAYRFGIWFGTFGLLFWKFSSFTFKYRILSISSKITYSKNIEELSQKMKIDFDFLLKKKDLFLLTTDEEFLVYKLIEAVDRYTPEDLDILKRSKNMPLIDIKKQIIKLWVLNQLQPEIRRYDKDDLSEKHLSGYFRFIGYKYDDSINLESYENRINQGYSTKDILETNDDEEAKKLILENKKNSDGFARKQNISEDLKKFILENGTGSAKYQLMLNPMTGENTCARNAFDFFNGNQVNNEFWKGKNVYDTPYNYFQRLNEDESSFTLILNPTLTNNDLEILSTSEGNLIRYLVARYPTTSLTILNKLAKDECEMVRSQVARSEKFASIEINHLINDSHPMVRKALALNSNVPLEVLEKLSHDTEKEIRIFVASHSTTSKEILSELSEDNEWDVRSAVGKHDNTDLGVLRRLSHDTEKYVQISVAENSNADLEILYRLSKHKDKYLRESLLQNQSTPLEILEKYKNDKCLYKKQKLLAHKNSSAELIDHILKKLKNKDISELLYSIEQYEKQCPLYLLNKLKEHKNEDINQSAKWILENEKIIKF